MDPPGHVGKVESTIVGGNAGMEHHLKEQVAQLLLQGLGPVAGGLVEVVKGFEDLVGLLQEVWPQ